jgi:hypothetical protein
VLTVTNPNGKVVKRELSPFQTRELIKGKRRQDEPPKNGMVRGKKTPKE